MITTNDIQGWTALAGAIAVLMGAFMCWQVLEWLDDDNGPVDKILEFLWENSVKIFLVFTALFLFGSWVLHA